MIAKIYITLIILTLSITTQSYSATFNGNIEDDQTISATQNLDTKTNSKVLEVMQNYPNPFQKNTKIRFILFEETPVRFKLYNMLGNLILDKPLLTNKGENELIFDREQLTSGIYFFVLETPLQTVTKRMNIKD